MLSGGLQGFDADPERSSLVGIRLERQAHRQLCSDGNRTMVEEVRMVAIGNS